MAPTEILSPEEARAYRVLCDFCSLLFTENPTEETLDRLIDERALLLEDPFATVAPEAAAELGALLASAAEGDRASFVTGVRRDYSYLFLMVGASHTSPFESVYRTDDRTMFGPTTLEVRESYRAWSVEVPSRGAVPDDHFGFEMAFASRLLALMDGADGAGGSGDANGNLAVGSGGADGDMAGGSDVPGAMGAIDSAAARRATEALGAFLADHVLVFSPVYLRNVGTQAKEPFYRLVAAIAEATVFSLAVALNVQASETIDEQAYLIDG